MLSRDEDPPPERGEGSLGERLRHRIRAPGREQHEREAHQQDGERHRDRPQELPEHGEWRLEGEPGLTAGLSTDLRARPDPDLVAREHVAADARAAREADHAVGGDHRPVDLTGHRDRALEDHHVAGHHAVHLHPAGEDDDLPHPLPLRHRDRPGEDDLVFGGDRRGVGRGVLRVRAPGREADGGEALIRGQDERPEEEPEEREAPDTHEGASYR